MMTTGKEKPPERLRYGRESQKPALPTLSEIARVIWGTIAEPRDDKTWLGRADHQRASERVSALCMARSSPLQSVLRYDA